MTTDQFIQWQEACGRRFEGSLTAGRIRQLKTHLRVLEAFRKQEDMPQRYRILDLFLEGRDRILLELVEANPALV